MIKKLLYLFIFFAPFTSFFAISAWFRIPIIVNQLFFLVLLVSIFKKGKLKRKWILKEDLFLLGLLVLVWLSFIFGFLEKRSFNHSLAYTNSILFYFFTIKYAISLLKIPSKEIARIMYWSLVTSSIIIIIDFIGINYFNFSLRRMFSTADGAISNMDYFIRGGFKRVGGVAEEPGHMALFYNIYFGVSLYYLSFNESIKKYVFVTVLFIICQFAMFSNAGIVLPIFAIIIIFSINKLKKLKITFKQLLLITSIFIILLLAIIAIFIFDIGEFSKELEKFANKILFNEDTSYSSSGQRLKQWQRALTNFVKKPILGNGPGYGVDEDAEGYLSVYFTILSDVGIIAFLLFLSFQQALVQKVMKLKPSHRSFLLFSVITSFLHLLIVADFYHAPIWVLFAIIQLVYSEKKSKLL